MAGALGSCARTPSGGTALPVVRGGSSQTLADRRRVSRDDEVDERAMKRLRAERRVVAEASFPPRVAEWPPTRFFKFASIYAGFTSQDIAKLRDAADPTALDQLQESLDTSADDSAVTARTIKAFGLSPEVVQRLVKEVRIFQRLASDADARARAWDEVFASHRAEKGFESYDEDDDEDDDEEDDGDDDGGCCNAQPPRWRCVFNKPFVRRFRRPPRRTQVRRPCDAEESDAQGPSAAAGGDDGGSEGNEKNERECHGEDEEEDDEDEQAELSLGKTQDKHNEARNSRRCDDGRRRGGNGGGNSEAANALSLEDDAADVGSDLNALKERAPTSRSQKGEAQAMAIMWPLVFRGPSAQVIEQLAHALAPFCR